MTGNGYVVVVEGTAADGFGAYSPDLPGVVATADTRPELERLMREAIDFHIEGLIADGLPVPAPSTVTDVLVIESPAA